MHENSAFEVEVTNLTSTAETSCSPRESVTPSLTSKSTSTEKEVIFSDVLVVAHKSPSNQSSKATITFPKSIIKNSILEPSKVASASSSTPPNWETHPLKPEATTTTTTLETTTTTTLKPETDTTIVPKPETVMRPESSAVIDTIGLIGLESDQESEADLFNVISSSGHKEGLGSDYADGSVASLEEEEEDEDFKVHFVHHGKKVEDKMDHQSADLMFQISELQEAVVSMKASLKEAVTKLSFVDGAAAAGGGGGGGGGASEVEELRRTCEGNSAEILKIVLTLKTDFSALRHDVTSVSKRQDALQKSFRLLLDDRRLLANDLSHAGVISQHTRNRLDSLSGIIGTGGQSGSGSHSNDSGVALLLEKTHNAFADDSGTLHLSGQRTSDQDSLPEQPSLLVPASVYDYVAGLSQQNASLSSTNTTNQFFGQESLPANPGDQSLRVKDENETSIRCVGDPDDLIIYDSDSSLTIAATKTMSLSTCIGQEMRVNDDEDDDAAVYSSLNSNPKSKNSHVGGSGSKHASEGSEAAKERNASSQSRRERRRPLLGVSSTKIYQLDGHCYASPPGEKDHHSRYRYASKGDPREAQRYKLAKELVDTEKQYCRTLWTIQDTFAEPLKKSALLSNKDISTLFPDEVYQLYDKHCLLQHQLKERLASWKWQPLIGDILTRFTDPNQCEVLRLYTSYVNDFPKVLKTFHKLCHTSEPFTEFIKECLNQPTCRGLDLGAFLLTPVQRVPKYILLLKQLLKYTDPRHPDYRLIEKVLERLRDFLSRLNDAMEHSFSLVNSSLSPTLNSVAGLTVTSVPTKYKNGRTSRKAGSSSRESPSSYSPSTRRNRHTRIYQPSSSSPSEGYRSPKRSCSSAGGASAKQKIALLNSAPGRSSSLPRGFTSQSSDSPDSSGDGQESSPERRTRPKSESASRYRSHEGTPYHTVTKYPSLTPAKSVTNLASSGEDVRSRWEDLAASEPSLVDSTKLPAAKSLSKKSPSLTSSHNLHATASTASTHKLVTWTESVESADDARAKKKTIKSSIKSMFTFKKRSNCQRNTRDEPLYWPSSVILETSAEGSPNHQPQGPSLCGSATLPKAQQSSASIGDFVDEDGNPCSNV